MDDRLVIIREMAEAHAKAHPECLKAMLYIVARCDQDA